MKAKNKNEAINKYDLNLQKGFIFASKIFVAINFAVFVVLKLTSPERIQGNKLWQAFVPVIAISVFISFTSFIVYNSIRSIGVYEGKHTFGAQVWVVMKRLLLCLFLPSFLITALLILIIYIVTGR